MTTRYRHRIAGLIALGCGGLALADGPKYYGKGYLYYPRPAGCLSPEAPFGHFASTWRVWSPPPPPVGVPPYTPPAGSLPMPPVVEPEKPPETPEEAPRATFRFWKLPSRQVSHQP